MKEKEIIEEMTSNDWYIKGNELRKAGLFGEAINAYRKACELDPESPAGAVIEIINDILDYRNTDLINP